MEQDDSPIAAIWRAARQRVAALSYLQKLALGTAVAGAIVGLAALLHYQTRIVLTDLHSSAPIRSARQFREARDRQRRLATERLADLAGGTPLERLQPVESGNGLLVCEPVATSAPPSAAAFARGCGRWVQFAVAGHSELGKTPLWAWIDRARRSLGLRDLQLPPRAARELARAVGASHVAVGELRGSGQESRLAYRVFRVEGLALEGAPLECRGSQESIRRSLPMLAAEMARRAGVRQPRVPAQVELAPAELADLGAVPWLPNDLVPAQRAQRLSGLARRSPVAALLYILYCTEQGRVEPALRAAGQLWKQMPEHPLGLGDAAAAMGDRLIRHPPFGTVWKDVDAFVDALDAQLDRFPNSLSLHIAAGVVTQYQQGRGWRRAVAEQVARCAPQSPDAWLYLSECIAEQAMVLGLEFRGKPMRRGIADDQASLRSQALHAAAQGSRLAPRRADVWLRVSESAAEAGDLETAAASLSRCLRLDPRSADAFQWGLDFYAEEGDAKDRRRQAQLARLAIRTTFELPCERIRVASTLDAVGFDDLAPRVLRTARERQKFAAFLREERFSLH